MRYKLVAIVSNSAGTGVLESLEFDDLGEAEKRMAHWAHYGVESFCDEASEIGIFDEGENLVRRWRWRTGESVPPEAPAQLS